MQRIPQAPKASPLVGLTPQSIEFLYSWKPQHPVQHMEIPVVGPGPWSGHMEQNHQVHRDRGAMSELKGGPG